MDDKIHISSIMPFPRFWEKYKLNSIFQIEQIIYLMTLLEFNFSQEQSSVSQQVGRGHLLLGRQNLGYSSILIGYGSPNCDLFCFVGRQLSGVENH